LGDGLILLITTGSGYLKNQNQRTTSFWYLKTNSKLKNQRFWLFQKTSKQRTGWPENHHWFLGLLFDLLKIENSDYTSEPGI
jgi:hypothetical protein